MDFPVPWVWFDIQSSIDSLDLLCHLYTIFLSILAVLSTLSILSSIMSHPTVLWQAPPHFFLVVILYRTLLEDMKL